MHSKFFLLLASAALSFGFPDVIRFDKRTEPEPSNGTMVPSSCAWTNLGCYEEPTNGRILPRYLKGDDALTVEKCYAYCLAGNFDYALVEFGRECWCDNTPNLRGGLWNGTGTGCRIACGGNTEELCGGQKKGILYKHNPSASTCTTNGCVPVTTTKETTVTSTATTTATTAGTITTTETVSITSTIPTTVTQSITVIQSTTIPTTLTESFTTTKISTTTTTTGIFTVTFGATTVTETIAPSTLTESFTTTKVSTTTTTTGVATVTFGSTTVTDTVTVPTIRSVTVIVTVSTEIPTTVTVCTETEGGPTITVPTTIVTTITVSVPTTITITTTTPVPTIESQCYITTTVENGGFENGYDDSWSLLKGGRLTNGDFGNGGHSGSRYFRFRFPKNSRSDLLLGLKQGVRLCPKTDYVLKAWTKSLVASCIANFYVDGKTVALSTNGATGDWAETESKGTFQIGEGENIDLVIEVTCPGPRTGSSGSRTGSYAEFFLDDVSIEAS